jgi:hypothetical protein
MGQSVERDVISTAGGVQLASQMEVNWTIGETVINSYFLNDLNVVSGYQQPIADSLNFIIEKIENEVIIYPNPFLDYIFISFNKTIYEDIQLHLFGASGQIVRRFELKKGSKLYKIEVPGLPSDYYSLLFIRNMEIISTQKIIK